MTTIELSSETIVDFLAEIFERRGDESYLGEEVTMAQHMLQGARLAEQEGAGDQLIAAALLHDIGHFTSEFGTFSMEDSHDRYHEAAGARIVERFFPPLVAQCVRQHVAAKRYLCATDPAYFDRLSEASVHSLKLQGGPMTAEEAKAFAKQPYLAEILRVRRWDDGGKVAGVATPPFSHYAPLLQRVVDARGEAA